MNLSTATPSLDTFATFGDLLKYLRRRARLTQLELSIAVGYSEAQISRLEKNQRLPDLTALKALFIPTLHLEDEPQLAARFLELAQSARQEDAPAPGIPPYKGLLFFDEADSDLFFGREALTAHLVEHVMGLAMDASTRFLAVVGASGSGKSSLVRAGLAVALKRAGWVTCVFTPAANPLRILEANLNPARTKNAERTLMLVDQFEEVFTLCRDEVERIAFIEKLLSIAQEESKKATIVIALRADFYSHCAQYPLLRQAVAAEQQYIGQMTAEELRRAIEEPARRGGWEFEPGLVDVLLQDIGAHGSQEPEPGALPLLSHALLATWEHRRGRTFTLEGYRASGGVRGAIAETAESVFNDQLDRAQQELARDVFLRLTELGEGTEDTRRRAALNELVRQPGEATQLRAVLNTLAEARLITLNEDSAEVAHEALIREWGRLHEWLTQDREGLLLHRHLTESAHEWEMRGRDPAELYRGARLAQAREWASANEQRLNASEQAFLVTSIEQEEQDALEREAQRQRELEAAQKLAETESRVAKQLRKRAVFLTGAFVIAIVLAVAAIFLGTQANRNASEAGQNAKYAQSRELAAAAISNLEEDPERSILLALQAESTVHIAEAENALHRSILASRVMFVLQHDNVVSSVTFSPDGKQIATASQGGSVKLWDAKTGQPLLTFKGRTGPMNSIVYSSDGKRIAATSATSDGFTAKVWDAATGEELLTLSGHTNWVSSVAFSPDGTRLVTTSEDGSAKVWDAFTGKELLTFLRHGDRVWDAAFHPDGKRIATYGQDGFVRIWDASSGEELLVLPFERDVRFGDAGLFGRLAFSPDGMRVAMTGPGNNAKWVNVWDATTGKVMFRGNLGHTGPPLDIAFSPDGRLAATGGLDQKAKVWDTITGQVLYTLSGHTNDIRSLAFSPDGTRLVTASWDKTVRMWDLTPGKEALFIPFANAVTRDWSMRLSYSPDGSRILSDYTDGNARIWDATSGKELSQLSPEDTNVLNTSYSLDGKLVATANEDNTITVWDGQTGKPYITLVGHNDFISQIVFSPDGTRLASASYDGKIIIWELASGKALRTKPGPKFSSIAYSPDGTRILSGFGWRQGVIWDATTGESLFYLPGWYEDDIWSVAYSADGKYVALGGHTGAIGIWSATTGQKLLDLKGHSARVDAITFSPDGKWIAATSADGTARVWDTTAGVNVLTLPVDSGGAGGISFSPDRKRLAVGGKSGIYVFVLPLDELIALAKSRLTRSLTTEECQQYLHVTTCPVGP
jgi:WD40 repeat protein/transcriptional regulator with XRE-family HTH domain